MQVIFFDGECVLCNSVVHRIAGLNPQGNIYYASLQGSYAKKIPEDIQGAATLIFLDGGHYYTRSGAVFELLKYLPALRWLRVFRFLPRRLTDALYDLVARNRIHWFGRQDHCRIPPPALRERFIAD